MNLPFSVYDMFGYLASGFLVLAAAEFGFDGNWLIERDWKPGAIVLYVTMAYVIGHIAANLASHLIEHKLGRDVFGASEELLFKKQKTCGDPRTVWERLFPGFFKPLPSKTQDRILKAAEPEGLNEPGRALYLHAFAVVKQDKATIERLNTFLNLYGFCRNIAFTLLVAAAMIAISGAWYAGVLGLRHPDWRKVGMALLCVVGSAGMLYRYLKFYRHYTQEVLITYPELKKTKDEKKKEGVSADAKGPLP